MNILNHIRIIIKDNLFIGAKWFFSPALYPFSTSYSSLFTFPLLIFLPSLLPATPKTTLHLSLRGHTKMLYWIMVDAPLWIRALRWNASNSACSPLITGARNIFQARSGKPAKPQVTNDRRNNLAKGDKISAAILGKPEHSAFRANSFLNTDWGKDRWV